MIHTKFHVLACVGRSKMGRAAQYCEYLMPGGPFGLTSLHLGFNQFHIGNKEDRAKQLVKCFEHHLRHGEGHPSSWKAHAFEFQITRCHAIRASLKFMSKVICYLYARIICVMIDVYVAKVTCISYSCIVCISVFIYVSGKGGKWNYSYSLEVDIHVSSFRQRWHANGAHTLSFLRLYPCSPIVACNRIISMYLFLIKWIMQFIHSPCLRQRQNTICVHALCLSLFEPVFTSVSKMTPISSPSVFFW